jgi:hypothetical protein
MRMKFGHYYIVDVAFRENNPTHRAIAFRFRGGHGKYGATVNLMAEGYGPAVLENVRLDKLAYFNLIQELTEMQNVPYKLPRCMPTPKEMTR